MQNQEIATKDVQVTARLKGNSWIPRQFPIEYFEDDARYTGEFSYEEGDAEATAPKRVQRWVAWPVF